ncbi:prefoldin subunit 4 [Galendromus occidentalis]|uniref:Prefoldin subunit 4 n=1 Tax=Galendromus occidentalis TaxID=34638 RepID=A0AAJ6VYV9_9ACAR|nr:prefoldin subunit 4 [Galendromus occidentalis]
MTQTLSSDEVNITVEDQLQINQFARHNQNLQELEAAIKAKNEEVQKLQDAADELMLGEDEDQIPYKMGDVFIDLPSDEIQGRLDADKEELERQISEYKDQIAQLKARMTELKTTLYGKFGSNINLEA